MERFRIAVGHRNGVKPGNIVGAIANEAGLDARYIGRIDIEEDFSLIDLPSGMPREILQDLRRVRVCGRPLAISRAEPGNDKPTPKRGGPRQASAAGPADRHGKRAGTGNPQRRPDKKNR